MAHKSTQQGLPSHEAAAWEQLCRASDLASFVQRLGFAANFSRGVSRDQADRLLDHSASALARGLLLISQLERNRLITSTYELQEGLTKLVSIIESSLLMLVEHSSKHAGLSPKIDLTKRVASSGRLNGCLPNPSLQ